MTNARFDLRAALRRRSADQLADLLRRVPALTEALQGRGPLAYIGPHGVVYPGGRQPQQPSIERLASVLASPRGIEVTLAALDLLARQLVTLAVFNGGALKRKEALAEVGKDRRDELEAAASRLHDLLLTDPDAGWVALRPGVAEVAGLPGYPVRDDLQQTNSDVIAVMLRNLGVAKPPSRKAERIDALEARLRDGEAVRAAAGRLPADAVRVFNVLLTQGPQRVKDVGVSYYNPWARQDTVLHRLTSAGLVGADYERQLCWAWFDVIVGLNGAVFSDWPAEPRPQAKPLRDAPGLPIVLGRVVALLDGWAIQPAQALQTGGLGVRSVRTAAKALGFLAGEVGLLAALAMDLGLLGAVNVGSKGSGRNRTPVWGWAPTELASVFAAEPAERRWAWLLQAWLDSSSFDETEGLPERVEERYGAGGSLARAALLRLLAEQPPGSGLDQADLAALAGWRAPHLLPSTAVGHVVAAARLLGLVPADGPVGLTVLGRAVLEGPDAVAGALPPPRDAFTVQADLSVIAPPDLAPDVGVRLERYAELESVAGARLYRLSETRIASALDAGEHAEQIISFLDEHATAPLAQNVTYLVRDCQRRHGKVRSGACSSYVRSDDPALLSRAVGVKAAKLRALAPTVAVSPLPTAKVVAALRARGLMPVAEDADGAVLQPQAPEARPVGNHGKRLPPLRPARSRDEELRLAERLLAAPEPAPSKPQQRGATKLKPAARYVRDERWDDPDEEIDEEDVATQRELLRSLIQDMEADFRGRGA